MYACGALRHHPGRLKEAVQADMTHRVNEYDVRDWLRILWAYGTLAQHPGNLFSILHKQVGVCCLDRQSNTAVSL